MPRMSASTSRRVAKNSVFYFFSLAIPAAAALFFVPITVRSLGASRFGLLGLAWAIAEGTGIFDFGLGRATVRFVADATVRSRDRVQEIVFASVFTQTAMGALAGLLLFTAAPVLATRVFHLDGAQIPEAITMFHVLSLHLPVLLGIAALRASLEGAQRFDISTSLRIPSSLASVIVPALAAAAGKSLGTIMWILLAVRISLFVITAIAVRRTLLAGGWRLPSDLQTLREMLRYSGWVAVSMALGPILGSFDRFVVGSVLTVTALGYYYGAAEASNRFLLVPVTAFTAILPALAATEASAGRDRSLAVTRAARRQLAVVLFPLCLTLFWFGPAALSIWLGPAFAAQAGAALRVLSVGVFCTGLAVLPLALLYGSNRPDLPAKINLFQAALHVPVTILSVRTWGITGAALAVALRAAEDLVFYEWARRRALGTYPPDTAETVRGRSLIALGAAISASFAFAAWLRSTSASAALLVIGLAGALYLWWAWRSVLAPAERSAWLGMFTRARAAA